jgi:hypothetical protein
MAQAKWGALQELMVEGLSPDPEIGPQIPPISQISLLDICMLVFFRTSIAVRSSWKDSIQRSGKFCERTGVELDEGLAAAWPTCAIFGSFSDGALAEWEASVQNL